MARFTIKHPFKSMKIYTPKGLFGRTALILFLPLLFMVSISTFVFFDRTWDSTTRRFATDLSGQISSLVYLVKNKNLSDKEVVDIGKNNFGFHVDILNKAFYKQAPKSKSKKLGYGILNRALMEKIDFPKKVFIGEDGTQVHVKIKNKVLRVAFPTKWLLNKTTTVFILWQFITPILFLIIALLFLRNQIRPLRRLSSVMDHFGKGQKVEFLRPSGASEVRQATRAFNRMQERLGRLVNRRMEMLAGISHDLRTPLTRLELELAMMEKSVDISNLRTDVKEMSSMVEAFLSFAKGQDNEKTQNVPLKTLITDSLLPIHAKWELNCDDDVMLPMRRIAMKRCFSNVLGNADKFADVININAKGGENWIIITIDDNGPGIPHDKRKEVFRPFYRLDISRNLDDGGVGLGLAIARDIVNQHGGKISLHDSPIGGLRVILKLPK